MKQVKKILFWTLIILFILGVSFFFWASDKYAVPIMMYHHIDTTQHKELNTVSPESFKKQMAYLKDHGYHVIRFGELVDMINEKRPLPRKSVVITFDDGYEDNYTYAFPILRKYQLPAIIFLPSDLIGTKDFLSWQQLREMVRSGFFDVGSHTRNHIYLPGYPDFERVKEEIVGSKHMIERNVGVKVNYFCYPVGGFTEDIKTVLKESGYKAACTTNRGFNRFNKDVFELKRMRFNNTDTSDFILWVKLSGYYNFFRKSKPPHTIVN